MTTFKDWNILRELKKEFVSKIKSVHIFEQNAVFIVTKSDCVYGFGNNINGCLGLGHKNAVKEPQIINKLCGRQVIKFIVNYCESNVYVLTKTGLLYSWGSNEVGQLGNGNTAECINPNVLVTLDDIKDFCCDSMAECLALKSNGKVFLWGSNSIGQHAQLIPNQLMALINYKVINIDSGGFHSLVLTEDGSVFGLGDNEYGQLGIRNKKEVNIPTKINLKNSRICKIKCGMFHSLMLSTDGDIYACGRNKYGEVGVGNKRSRLKPVKLQLSQKCLDIATINNTCLSIAKMEDGFCYVWGECCDNRTFPTPYKTNYTEFNDVVLHFSTYKISYNPIICDQNEFSVIAKRLINSFNDQKYSDIAFRIDGKLIYVQKSYLRSVCKHFEDMFNPNNSSENFNKEINITQYSYPVYYAFLKYLYSGCVIVEPEHLFELIDLAKCYLEDEFMCKCVELTKNDIK